METTMDLVRPGVEAVVVRIDAGYFLKRRLKDFGLVPGTAVRCRYRSPGRDVTALEFRGTVVALRTRDLKRILVRT